MNSQSEADDKKVFLSIIADPRSRGRLIETSALRLRVRDGMDGPPGGEVMLLIESTERLRIGALAFRQIVDHAGIPWRFAQRLLAEGKSILVVNVNWTFRRFSTRRILCIRDGALVAFLPPAYAGAFGDRLETESGTLQETAEKP